MDGPEGHTGRPQASGIPLKRSVIRHVAGSGPCRRVVEWNGEWMAVGRDGDSNPCLISAQIGTSGVEGDI